MSISGFSAHGDRQRYLALLALPPGETGTIRSVCGGSPQTEALDVTLHHPGFADVAVPHRQDQVRVA